MPQRFKFDSTTLYTMVGGRSAIDTPKLNIQTLKEASSFVASYGFNFENEDDVEKLWYYHRRALVLLTEKLNFKVEDLPEVLRDQKSLQDLRKLLLWASSSDPREVELQRWSCALLRVIHVFVHAENDLFSTFSEEIQKQILGPFQDCIFHDGTTGSTFLKANSDNTAEYKPIQLLGFEVKPFKTSSSTVIKLLAKPDALAMSVFDKLGLRFIAKSMFDCFQVIRFLVEEHLISYPHIMPDQSHNNLFPIDLFLQACAELAATPKVLNESQIEEFFHAYLARNIENASYLKRENSFSGVDYQNIKFICRKLIRVAKEKQSFSFFYPFEVQIMDQAGLKKVQSGPSEHQAYKERQRLGARKRLFPESVR